MKLRSGRILFINAPNVMWKSSAKSSCYGVVLYVPTDLPSIHFPWVGGKPSISKINHSVSSLWVYTYTGYINLPGGRREYQDKTPLDTLNRECLEELGIPNFFNDSEYIGVYETNKTHTQTYLYVKVLQDPTVMAHAASFLSTQYFIPSIKPGVGLLEEIYGVLNVPVALEGSVHLVSFMKKLGWAQKDLFMTALRVAKIPDTNRYLFDSHQLYDLQKATHFQPFFSRYSK